jgi:hypothetical protein
VLENGTVQITIEENTGQFDPDPGAELEFTCRSAEEIEAGE